MPSATDPTMSVECRPALRADLRPNLAAAKGDLEHGRFAESLRPVHDGRPSAGERWPCGIQAPLAPRRVGSRNAD